MSLRMFRRRALALTVPAMRKSAGYGAVGVAQHAVPMDQCMSALSHVHVPPVEAVWTDKHFDVPIPEDNMQVEKHARQLNPTMVTNFMKIVRGEPLTAQQQVDILEEFRYWGRRPKQLKVLCPESSWHVDHVAQWCKYAKYLKLLKPKMLLHMSESIIDNVHESSVENIVLLLDCYAAIIDVPECVTALTNELEKRELTPQQASLALSAVARLGDAPCPLVRRLCDFLVMEQGKVFQDEDLWPMIEGQVAAPRDAPVLSGKELAQAAWALEKLGYLWSDVTISIADKALELLPDRCTSQELSMLLSYLAKSPAQVEDIIHVFGRASIGFQRHMASANSVMMAQILESFAHRGFADDSMARRLIAQLPRTYCSPNSSATALQSMIDSLRTLGVQSQALDDYAPAMLAERMAFSRDTS
eukprot:GEMP01054581.1.p1 GENE.GEMP01054581.1~~GEMP01054581.1.p1  ORF type:complete len:460 (+),score=107.39 GEMP01054581.1:134-1381(+)